MPKKYNLIYIHTHDSGKIFEPYYSSILTPNYQNFVDEALVFDRAFAASPTCSPSRASLLTGQMPHQNGMLGLANRGFELNDYSKHLVSILNKVGYTTCLCGIQHEYGRYTNFVEGANKIGYKVNLTTEIVEDDESDYYRWDYRNAEQVVNYLSSHDKNRPFFLSYGMFMTHRQYPIVKEKFDLDNCYFPEWLEKDEVVVDDYLGHLQSLRYFDECFGKVWRAIKDNGLVDNTIIVVTTDHGIAFPFAKCNLTDRGLGVNFSIKIPNNKNNGKRFNGLFSQVDFVPTILSLLNVDYEYTGVGIDFSHSLVDNLFSEREYVFGEVNFHTSYEPIRSVRSDKYLFIKYFDDYKNFNLSNIDDSLTKDYYIEQKYLNGTKELEQFYDLEKDPNQLNNLIFSEDYFEIIKDFKIKMFQFMVDTDDFLLNKEFEWKKSWIINKKEAVSPKNKDYII